MNLSEPENAAQSDRPAGPGAVLGETREAQNLSVADVARQLKLSVHQVEALEAGEYDKLPGPVFVRGFIRNYARFLKLDPERLVHSAARSLPQEESRPAAPPSQDIPFPTVAPPRWRMFAIVVAAALLALAGYEFFLNEPRTGTRPVSAPEPTASGPVPAPTDNPGPGVQPGAPAVRESAPAAATPAQEAAPAANAAAVTAPEPPPATSSSPGEREVRMVFRQESWVEIRDRSGKAIFSQLNRSGTEKRVNGRPPLSVIVGNSHGVQLTYDDQPVDLARHTKVDVARLVLE